MVDGFGTGWEGICSSREIICQYLKWEIGNKTGCE